MFKDTQCRGHFCLDTPLHNHLDVNHLAYVWHLSPDISKQIVAIPRFVSAVSRFGCHT